MSDKRRMKGEGSLVELPNGKVKVRVSFIDEQGKFKTVSKTVTKKEAPKVLRELQGKKDNNEIVIKKTTTMREAGQIWLESKRPPAVKKRTYYWYSDFINVIMKTLGYIQIQRLTTKYLDDYLDNLRTTEGLSEATIKKHVFLIKSILEIAKGKKVITSNPADDIRKISKSQRGNDEVKVIPEDVGEKLRKVAKDEYDRYKGFKNKFWMMYPILVLADDTGIREGEVAGLRVSNFYPNERKLTVDNNVSLIKGEGLQSDKPKSQSSRRSMYISKTTTRVLEEVLEIRKEFGYESDYLFCTRTGQPLDPHNIYRAFKQLLVKAEVDTSFCFHHLRHTSATRLIGKGINVKTVSLRLGHSDIKTTLNTYAHAINFADQLAADIYDDLQE